MKGRDKTFKKLDSGKSVSHGHLYIAFVECNKPHTSHWKKIPNMETEGKVGVQHARNPQAHTRTTPTTKIVVRKHMIWEIAQKIASNRLVTVIRFISSYRCILRKQIPSHIFYFILLKTTESFFLTQNN